MKNDGRIVVHVHDTEHDWTNGAEAGVPHVADGDVDVVSIGGLVVQRYAN